MTLNIVDINDKTKKIDDSTIKSKLLLEIKNKYKLNMIEVTESKVNIIIISNLNK